eukprot:XP_001704425.1 Hypothetical protein GL50803_36007 [Giardia lamblia ATCC 50803]
MICVKKRNVMPFATAALYVVSAIFNPPLSASEAS